MVTYTWNLSLWESRTGQNISIAGSIDLKPARNVSEAAYLVRMSLVPNEKRIFEGELWRKIEESNNRTRYCITKEILNKNGEAERQYELHMLVDTNKKAINIED